MPLIMTGFAEKVLGPLVGCLFAEDGLRCPVVFFGPPGTTAGTTGLGNPLSGGDQGHVHTLVDQQLLGYPDATVLTGGPPLAL